jgi:hypothetical protein
MYGSSPSDPSHIPTKTDPPCFTFPPHTSGRTKSNKIRVTFATKKIYTPGRQKKSIPSGTRGLGGGNLSYATPKMAQQPARALPYDDPKIAQKRFGDGSDPFASSEVFRTPFHLQENQAKMHTETGKFGFEPRNPERGKSQNRFFFFPAC